MQEIEKIKEKYLKQIDDFLFDLENSFHSELFPEEFDEILDSNVETIERMNGVNPMKKSYADKINKKRNLLGVSKLGNNGLKTDYSSNIYVRKIIFEYINAKINSDDLSKKRKSNISSFLKKTE